MTETEKVFYETIERCARLAETLGPWRMADNVGYIDIPATGEQIAQEIRKLVYRKPVSG